jgi:hypothetical protein
MGGASVDLKECSAKIKVGQKLYQSFGYWPGTVACHFILSSILVLPCNYIAQIAQIAQMALASLVPFQGPKKSRIQGPPL